MTEEEIAKAIGLRLCEAREAAGFTSKREAAMAFGWNYPTYSSHEGGWRRAKQVWVEKYVKAFQSRGSKITAQYVMFGYSIYNASNGKLNEKETKNVSASSPEMQAINEYKRHARTLMELWLNADATRRALAIRTAKAILGPPEDEMP